jgi:hypothetical protein
MPLMFREAHATADKKQLNGEWFILENAGATSVSTAGLQVISGKKGKRGSVLGVIDPGFMLQPARDGMRTYHLFQKEPLLQGDGTIIKLAMNQLEVARFTYDRSAATGVAQPEQNDKQ